MHKYDTMAELCKFEEDNHVWEMKFLEYPVWIHCRETMSGQGISITSVFYRPSLKSIIKSAYETIKFLFSQGRYSKVYFLANRAEMLQVYKEDKVSEKILFLHKEQKDRTSNLEYISADFFNVIRYLFRKITYGLFFIKYRKMVKELSRIGYDESRFIKIKNAMGDAVFLKLLSWVLKKDMKTFYAGAVVPAGEKFINRLNSHEVQHGVIHSQHVGYMGIPEVKNKLIAYDKRYMTLLINNGYKGQIELKEFKKKFLQNITSRKFKSVIYTQPIEAMQKGIKVFFKKEQRDNIYIQKHPQDFFDYDLEDSYFVYDTIPSEVDTPICYTSTIIENFTLLDRECYIYDIEHESIDLDNFLSVYIEGTAAQMHYFNDLEDIYKDIRKRKS